MRGFVTVTMLSENVKSLRGASGSKERSDERKIVSCSVERYARGAKRGAEVLLLKRGGILFLSSLHSSLQVAFAIHLLQP